MTHVVFALGSNIGDRGGNLRRAVARLAGGGVAVNAVSSAWETAPVPADQPAFLNAAVAGETARSPKELLMLAKGIEHALGRRPSRHWGPRPIDVDILFYGDEPVETNTLTIPHSRIAERAFVLAPLSEVERGRLPVLGKTALELLAEVDGEGLRRTGEDLSPRIEEPHWDRDRG